MFGIAIGFPFSRYENGGPSAGGIGFDIPRGRPDLGGLLLLMRRTY